MFEDEASKIKRAKLERRLVPTAYECSPNSIAYPPTPNGTGVVAQTNDGMLEWMGPKVDVINIDLYVIKWIIK